MAKFKKIIILSFCYVIAISILTYPLILFLTSGGESNSTVIGNFDHPDLPVGLWFRWWLQYSLENNLDFFHCDYLAYPHGENLWVTSGNFLTFFLFSPLIKICGLVRGYNLSAFIILLFNCLSGFLLINELVKNKYLAFIGGFLIAINCFTLVELISGRLEQVSLFWMVFWFWALVKLKNTGQRRFILPAALFFLLTSLNLWHYGIILCFAGFLWMFVLVVQREWRVFKCFLFSFLLGGLLILPVLVIFINNFRSEYNLNLFNQPYNNSDFLILLDFMRMGSLNSANIFSPAGSFAPKVSAVVFIFSLLIIVTGKEMIKENKYWILLWTAGFIFSLGPVFQYASTITKFRLPFYYFAKCFPFMGRFIWPYRFLVLFYLSSVIIISVILKLLLAGRNKYIKLLILGLFVGVWIFELSVCKYIFPVTSGKLEISSVYPVRDKISNGIYYELAKLPQGAILELPYCTKDRRFIYAQTIHGKKMVNNTTDNPYVVSAKTRKFIGRFDLSGRGWVIRGKEDVDFLRQLGVKYIILREDRGRRFFNPPVGLFEYGKTIKERFDFLLGEPYMYNDKEKVFLYIL